jgi:hypothetical protein
MEWVQRLTHDLVFLLDSFDFKEMIIGGEGTTPYLEAGEVLQKVCLHENWSLNRMKLKKHEQYIPIE